MHFGRVPRKTKKAMKAWPNLTPMGKRRVQRFCMWFAQCARRRDELEPRQ